MRRIRPLAAFSGLFLLFPLAAPAAAFAVVGFRIIWVGFGFEIFVEIGGFELWGLGRAGYA